MLNPTTPIFSPSFAPAHVHAPSISTRAACDPPEAPVAPAATVSDPEADAKGHRRAATQISDALRLLHDTLAPLRRVVHAGEVIHRAGEPFTQLFVLNSGFVKIVNLAGDGREQVVGFKFRGDWMGFDGIATSRYACDAIAMDTGEVWVFRYDALIAACGGQPALLPLLHAAMSREIAGDRASLMSVCTLPADARVADFLRYWAESLARRGLRNDQITLHMTRADIGNYLGMTLETVSRALSKLARANVIAFAHKGRRELCIPDVAALSAFVQRSLAPSVVLPATLQ